MTWTGLAAARKKTSAQRALEGLAEVTSQKKRTTER